MMLKLTFLPIGWGSDPAIYSTIDELGGLKQPSKKEDEEIIHDKRHPDNISKEIMMKKRQQDKKGKITFNVPYIFSKVSERRHCTRIVNQVIKTIINQLIVLLPNVVTIEEKEEYDSLEKMLFMVKNLPKYIHMNKQ